MSLPDFSTLNTESDGATALAENDSPTSSGDEADQPATATLEPTDDLLGPSERPMSSRRASFWVLASVVLLASFAANAAASPLYRVYQAHFRFSVTTLTLPFAVYVFAVLATLLVLGSLSDYVGRRGAVLAGLVAGRRWVVLDRAWCRGSVCRSGPARGRTGPDLGGHQGRVDLFVENSSVALSGAGRFVGS